MKIIYGLKDSYKMSINYGIKTPLPTIYKSSKAGIIVGWIGALLLLIFLGAVCASAEESYTDEQIVNAIGKAENSIKYPYGIKSIKCNTPQECRQICLNSVRNAKKRWARAGKPEDFITFMGRRYSPPATNPNWVRLVKYFLAKEVK